MNLKFQSLLIFITLTGSIAFCDEIGIGNNFDNIKNLYRNAQYTEVVESAKKILKISPNNEEARELLARSLFQLKDYKSVINLYSEKQAEFIASPLQLKLRTLAQAREGNFYSAMLALRELREDEVLGHEWKVYYHYLVFKINKESAFKELKRMSQVSPNIIYDLIAGDLHILAGDNQKAIGFFEAALKKNYLNTEAMEKLGDCYIRSGEYEKALNIYRALAKINNSDDRIKIKQAWALEKDGYYLDALKSLENENHPSILEYKNKLALRVQKMMNNNSQRSIAEEQSISPVDGTLALEAKVIPMPPLEIAAEENPQLAVQVKAVKPQDYLSHEEDKSIIELSFGPKAKKYDLTGVGFNARVNYSSGMSANAKYTFVPENRAWETVVAFDYSKVAINNLRGVTPADITLTEIKSDVGVSYKFGGLSVGPSLMYEKMSATQTTPNPIRGNIDLTNVGLRAGYGKSFSDKFHFKLDLSAHTKLVTTSKTTIVGSVDKRTMISGALKFYYTNDPFFNYFVGAIFASTETAYEGSQGRGTTAAKEKEQDITFPLGINYVF